MLGLLKLSRNMLQNNTTKLVNYLSRKPVTPKGLVFTGSKSPWEFELDIERTKSLINIQEFKASSPKLSKYLPFMPFSLDKYSDFLPLTDNATPLKSSVNIGKRLGINLLFKLDFNLPTRSFKDRGTAVDIALAKSLGAKAVVVASTGNMAASCACYSAVHKIPCYVVVPEKTPESKLAQVIQFGGIIVKVKGVYDDAAKLAYNIARKKGYFLAGNYAPRIEGQKTGAFEIIDELSMKNKLPPHLIILPMGCGTNLASYGKGLIEYAKIGFLDPTLLPRLIGVQAQGACSIIDSFLRQSRVVKKLDTIHTVASAIAVAHPNDGVKALDMIKATKGEAVSVTDDEILQAKDLLSKDEGLFVESSSATTLAYLLKQYKTNPSCLSDKTVVCVLTGDGLKESNSPTDNNNTAHTYTHSIKPCLTAFERFYSKSKIKELDKHAVCRVSKAT